ncbi:MAG: M23 family metallopeptidase [Actinomycetota bacterium]|nr:M23 family metallopeptidase [Actinomycetota bacterium]
MAGVTRTLSFKTLAVIILVVVGQGPVQARPADHRAITSSATAPGAYEFDSHWYGPREVQGKVFPVGIPADGKWLNWIDTFGAPRMRLVAGVWKQVGVHEGTDIYAERGSPVMSVTSGVVENIGWTFYSGYRVGVRGTDGAYYFYAHLLRPTPAGLVKGSTVKTGQRIGTLGNSGYGPEGTIDEFPPHLHFGVQRGETWIDAHQSLVDTYRATMTSIRGSLSQITKLDGELANPAAPDKPTLSAKREALIKELAIFS